MSEGRQDRTTEEQTLERVDPNLTVFALANGLDLKKEEGRRRLEWFADGLERGIEISADASGTLTLTACTWAYGESELQASAPAGNAINAGDLSRHLEEAIGAANRL